MVRQFSKPQEAREIEARARACACAIRLTVEVEARRYRTISRTTGEPYAVVRTPVGWACSCLGYFHSGVCKHLGAVQRRAAREGWPFGAIAPLSQVARYFPLDRDPDPDPEPDPEPTPPAGAGALPDPDELAARESPQWDGGRGAYEARASLARQRAAALADRYGAD